MHPRYPTLDEALLAFATGAGFGAGVTLIVVLFCAVAYRIARRRLRR